MRASSHKVRDAAGIDGSRPAPAQGVADRVDHVARVLRSTWRQVNLQHDPSRELSGVVPTAVELELGAVRACHDRPSTSMMSRWST